MHDQYIALERNILDHVLSSLHNEVSHLGVQRRLMRWGQGREAFSFLDSQEWHWRAGSTLHPITLAGPGMEAGNAAAETNSTLST